MSDDFNTYITVFHNVLNAYAEATKNNIITLQDKYAKPPTTMPITTHDPTDFSVITGIKIIGANPLTNGLTSNNNMTVSLCADKCIANVGCVGALYTDGTDSNTCQLYSEMPLSNVNYLYDASSSFILNNHYLPTGSNGITGATGTINSIVMNALDVKLTIVNNDLKRTIPKIDTLQTNWNKSKDNLNVAKTAIANAAEDKKNNQDVKSQLYNSGLDVIKTKTKYILFIAVLLIVLAIYVRDFNFSIFIYIILFLMISVYGSIFLGAFLLLVIVLYLVYYAY